MFKLHDLKSFFFPTFYFGPEAAVVAPELVEGATVAGGLTEAEIAAQQLLAEQQAAAALQAQQAAEAAQAMQQATNEAIRNTITQTPVSSAGSGISSLASSANPAAGGLSNLVNTTGGPATWEQVFSQGKNIAEGSTELGKLADASRTLSSLNPAVDLGTNPEVLQQLQALKGALPLGPNSPPVDVRMYDFGNLVNPYQTASLPASAVPPVEPVPAPAPAPAPAPFTPPSAPPPAVEVQAVRYPTPDSEMLRGRITPTGLGGNLSANSPILPNTTVGLGDAPVGTRLATGADAGIKALAQQVGIETPTTVNATLPSPTTPVEPTNFTSAHTLSYPPSGAPPAGADQLTQLNVRNAVTGQGVNPGVYQEAVAKTPFSPVGSTPTQFAGNVSNFGANPAGSSVTPPSMPAYYGFSGNPTDLAPEVLKDASISPTYNNPFLMQAEAASAPEESGIKGLFNQGLDWVKKNPLSAAMGANALATYLNAPKPYQPEKYKSTWNGSNYRGYTPIQPTPYRAQYAEGGVLYAGDNPGLPMQGSNDPLVFQSTGVERMASGGISSLGSYSDGGRMLKGPGDGMSDDIPATIADKQPARLANEEFVIPADVVSHLGNGSSEAGAKQLYKMMDRVRQARTGTKKQGKQIKPEKYLA